jgi:hypothetical protein
MPAYACDHGRGRGIPERVSVDDVDAVNGDAQRASASACAAVDNGFVAPPVI